MESPELQHLLQNLDYGHIYVIGNPKQTTNLRWFASMIEPMIRPLSLQWVETWHVDHKVIAARRFNVGNMGRYATVQLHLNRYGRSDSYSLLAAVHTFSDCLSDVMDDGQGDVIINEREYSDRNEPPHGTWGASTSSTPLGHVLDKFEVDSAPQDHTRVERPHKFDRIEFQIEKQYCRKEEEQRRRKEKEEQRRRQEEEKLLEERRRDADESAVSSSDEDLMCYIENDDSPVLPTIAESSDVQDLEVEEIRETREIESEYERDVRDLRARIVAFIAKYHQDPEQVMSVMLEGKVLLGPTPGRLLVNGDMKIVLPDYDEMEIKMPAMSRTLYILFMKHRVMGLDGFELKNIDQYRDEMVNIYSLVKPGADDDRVRRTVDNLCDPFSNSLNEAISRANGFIRKCIVDKNLQKQYLISGARGGKYSIGLSPEMIALPNAVMQEGIA
ncbi:MAG: hypothetical protein IJ879_10375 [Muribaculaceae bacterium]|nr:hypothetical protein [Muribaculaceae bacterium]